MLYITLKADYTVVESEVKTVTEYPKISLKAARVNANYSQKKAAKAIGIDVSTLQKYEACVTVPNWATVRKIQEIYNFPIDYIFFPKSTL